MVGGECRIVGKSCHAVARSKASIESSRQIRPDTNRIAGGKTSAARSAWCIDKVKIRIEVGDTPDSRAADEIGPAEGQLPLVEHCSRKNMVLTEGDVLVPAHAERKKLRIPGPCVSGAEVVVGCN